MEERLEVTSENKRAFCPRVKVTLSASFPPKQYSNLKAEATVEADVPDLLCPETNRDIRAAIAEAVRIAEAQIASQLGHLYAEAKGELDE